MYNRWAYSNSLSEQRPGSRYDTGAALPYYSSSEWPALLLFAGLPAGVAVFAVCYMLMKKTARAWRAPSMLRSPASKTLTNSHRVSAQNKIAM